MGWLALTVYRRGGGAQDALLGALAPVLRALASRGALGALWATRFDARGPHLFLLLEARREDEVREALEAALRAHLRAAPPSPPMDEAELLRRHAACRGNALAPDHRLPGLAPADGWVLEPQPANGYPLPLLRGMEPAAARAFLDAASVAFHWAAARVAAGEGTRGALAWAAALDRALAAAGRAGEVWRHEATLLLPALGERLARGEDVAPSLERALSPGNRARFDAAWKVEDAETAVLARALVAAVHAPGVPEAARLPALREALHSVLLLLGLPVSAQLPLVLYAWLRTLAPAGAR